MYPRWFYEWAEDIDFALRALKWPWAILFALLALALTT